MRKRGPGLSCRAVSGAKEVNQKMWRLVFGQHQALYAKCVGSRLSGVLGSRWSICDRPQKEVTCWGRQMTCMVEDGQGHGWIGPMSVWAPSEIVGVGTCEMITGDESW